ncbi:MAG: hypothetical protein AB1444_12395 [Spirochaetota bacterium]
MKKLTDKIHPEHLPVFIITIAILLCFIVIQKIYFTVLLKPKITPQIIEEIFENNFKKAIQFDSSSVTLGGNIVLKNVKIAPTTDFNDNYNFISCKKAIIDLNYFKAITGSIVIKGVTFTDASMTIVKNYGKSYLETFKGIFSGIVNGNTINLDDFYMELDGSLLYNENLSTDKLKLSIQDVSLAISLKNKHLSYTIKGEVLPTDSSLDSGRIHISGIINYTDAMGYKSSHHSIYAKKLDMHIVNYFIKEYTEYPITVKGYFYTDCNINHDSGYSFKGTVEFDNCTIENIKNIPHFEYIAKDNISIDAQMDCKEDLSEINVSSFAFNDKEISIDATVKYIKDKLLQFYFSTNQIDLDDCDYIQLIPGMFYDGSLKILTQFDFDIANDTMKSCKILCDVHDISVFKKVGNSTTSYLKNARLKVEGDVKSVILDFFTKHKQSDILVHSKINIDKWAPFTSTTDMSITSKQLQSDVLEYLLADGISSLYTGAMEDMGIGYNEIFFRDKPLGKYLINNIIKLKFNIGKLLFEKNAHLKNINIDLISNKGTISTPSFNCEGYSGIYSFNINAFCNCDYPNLNITAGVSNFDYGRYLQDCGQKNATGVMNVSLNYSVSGYRPSHLLQNGNGLLQITIANTIFNKTLLQKKISEVATTCNVSFPDGVWHCNRLDLTINHVADRWILQNMFIDTDMVQLGGYGNYTIDKGLSLPCYASIFTREGPVIKGSQRINFVITGSLDNPVIVTGTPCGKKEISVFDVN